MSINNSINNQTNGIYPVNGSNISVDVLNRQLKDNNSPQQLSIDWVSRFIYDQTGSLCIDYNNRINYDSSINSSIDWANRFLVYTDGSTDVLQWGALQMYDSSGNISHDWGVRILYDSANNASVDYTNRRLMNNFAILLDWNSANLLDGHTANFKSMGLQVVEGSNAKQGVSTLASGTVTVSNTSVTANSRIFLTAQDNNSIGALRISARTAGTSFTITSNVPTDSGVVAWEIFEPA